MKYPNLSALLAAAIEREPITTRAAGDEIGVSSPAVSKWITGQTAPTPDRFAAVAAAFGLTEKDLADAIARDRGEPEPRGPVRINDRRRSARALANAKAAHDPNAGARLEQWATGVLGHMRDGGSVDTIPGAPFDIHAAAEGLVYADLADAINTATREVGPGGRYMTDLGPVRPDLIVSDIESGVLAGVDIRFVLPIGSPATSHLIASAVRWQDLAAYGAAVAASAQFGVVLVAFDDTPEPAGLRRVLGVLVSRGLLGAFAVARVKGFRGPVEYDPPLADFVRRLLP